MFDLFTEQARTVIIEAQAEAVERGDRHLGTEHLLVGLLREGTGPAARILTEHSADLVTVRRTIDVVTGRPPAPQRAQEALAAIGIDLAEVHGALVDTFGPGALDPEPVPFDDAAKDALQLAVAEASTLDPPNVTTEHELLGLIGVPDGIAAKVMRRIGIDTADLADDIRRRAATRSSGS